MTIPSDPLSSPLVEIAHDLREKRVTARELIEAAIARHERFGERLHAYSLWAPEQARSVAAAADSAFSGSSRRLPADPWERDGPLVATLRRQLGVIMGKTHMVSVCWKVRRCSRSAVTRRAQCGFRRV